MANRFIDVFVEEHDALPDGCMMRFHALEEPRPVGDIDYAPLLGEPGRFRVAGLGPAGETAALCAHVDDSGAGKSTLIWGGELGLRLHRLTPSGADDPAFEPLAEPYLLLAADEVPHRA